MINKILLFLLIPTLAYAGTLKVWNGSVWEEASLGTSSNYAPVASPVFTGNVGIGSTTPRSALDVNGTVTATSLYEGANQVGMTLVETASPSSASSFTFSNLSPGVVYKIVYIMTQNTNVGSVSINFNADTTTSRYPRALIYQNTSSPLAYTDGGSVGLPSLGYSSIAVGARGMYEVIFRTLPGADTSVFVVSYGYNYGNTLSAYLLSMNGGTYNGLANLSSATISTSAGTMTGTAKLYRMN